jgi:hypothetical protein
VLPRGCTKVRYYGIFSPRCRSQRLHAASLLPHTPAPPLAPSTSLPPLLHRCPLCTTGNLVLIGVLSPVRTRSP